MIDERGLREMIEVILAEGTSMRDIRDLVTLYSLLESLKKEKGEYSRAKSSGTMMQQMAEKWTASMKNVDPAKPQGAKWSVDQIRPFGQKYGIPTDGEKFWAFYAMINAMYSDYYEVAKKYNVATPEFFADMAKAFIDDKDAVENKTAKYYEYIVEH